MRPLHINFNLREFIYCEKYDLHGLGHAPRKSLKTSGGEIVCIVSGGISGLIIAPYMDTLTFAF